MASPGGHSTIQFPPGPAGADAAPVAAGASLSERYRQIRAASVALCRPLATEDYCIQSMPDVSPTKWHLAHTSWFFETFVLAPAAPGYQPFHPQFGYLFNSYYLSVGQRHCRPKRGLLSRPTVQQVYEYRNYVDQRMLELLERDASVSRRLAPFIEVGLHHEQQHQELMLTDIKHVFWVNPLHPAYHEGSCSRPGYRAPPTAGSSSLPSAASSPSPGTPGEGWGEGSFAMRADRPCAEKTLTLPSPGVPGEGKEGEGHLCCQNPWPHLPPMRWVRFGESLAWIGHEGNAFAYDNELPRHRVWLNSFELASRLVTSGQYQAFMEDGGYQRGELWLSDGWRVVQEQGWEAPMYWEKRQGRWWLMTLAGLRPVEDDEPVCHVSYFEADAFARWAGSRLPTEAEWERASAQAPLDGNFVEAALYHPAPLAGDGQALGQMFGDLWQWTASAYLPYPGYRAPAGALGEYNGKFMCNQFVLRGGSCATPRSHIRRTYRNFFPPDARWQFMGFRLARDA